MSVKDKCPYCGKKDCIPQVAFTNAEIYDQGSYIIKCNHCKGVLSTHISRITRLDSIEKSNSKVTNW